MVNGQGQQAPLLDDGSVWVSNTAQGKLARFNPRIGEADAVVPVRSSHFDLAQNANTTLLKTDQTLTTLDPLTLSPQSPVPTPADLYPLLAAGTLALFNARTGQVWVSKAGHSLPNPAKLPPTVNIGPGASLTLDADGRVYAYQPHGDLLFTMAGPNAPIRQTHFCQTPNVSGQQLSVIHGRPLVLSGHTLYWDKGHISLPLHGSAQLQASPVDSVQQGSWAGVADEQGIFFVHLNHPQQEPTFLPTGSSGPPAQPFSSGGCIWSAWASQERNFARLCGVNGQQPPANPVSTGRNQSSSGSTLDQRVQSLADVNLGSSLRFRSNKRQVVLNDISAGLVWDPQQGKQAASIDWQHSTLSPATHRTQSQASDTGEGWSQTCAAHSGHIRALDDSFRIRSGSRAILDPLRNDQQSGCALASISQTSTQASVQLTPIEHGRLLQVDASAAQPGHVQATYTIDDGQGQSSTASLSLELIDSKTNEPPVFLDPPSDYALEQGGQTTLNAIEAFVDPQSDPLMLVDAQVQASDQLAVRLREDGKLTITASEQASGRIPIDITASNGQEQTTGRIYCVLSPAGSLPAQVDPLIRRIPSGHRLNLSLESSIHASARQEPTLDHIQELPGLETQVVSNPLGLLVKASKPGNYYVTYQVHQGSHSSQGLVRIEATNPDRQKGALPLTADDTALLNASNQATIDPLSNDNDPQGNPLTVTSVSSPSSSQVRAIVVDHRLIHVSLAEPLRQPLMLAYTASNQYGSSSGQIHVLPHPAHLAPPPLNPPDIHAQARPGSTITIPVISTVASERGDLTQLSAHLEAEAASLPATAFVNGQSIRYQAGQETGSSRLTYTLTDAYGQSAQGKVSVTVSADQPEQTPVHLPDIRTQATAGSTLTIAVNLEESNLNSGNLNFLGLGSRAPQLGRITSVGAQSLRYEAYPDARGVDSFTYAALDQQGRYCEGTIAVGIAPGERSVQVLARDDQVDVRPGTSVAVAVTNNDLSEDGQELQLDPKLVLSGLTQAHVQGNRIVLTSPDQTGSSYIVYRVSNPSGGSDQATLRVVTSPQAPIQAPLARDFHLSFAATQGRRTVSVDLTQQVSNPSGPEDDLQVSLPASSGANPAQPAPATSKQLTVHLSEHPRVVTYTLTNTRYQLASSAFLYLPAYGASQPELKNRPAPVTVRPGQTLVMNVSDLVQVSAGKQAVLSSPESIQTTHADGSQPYRSAQQFAFTPARGYLGPASITLTVQDNPGQVTWEHRSVLTIPITVTDGSPAPPRFSSPTVELELSAGSRQLSLRAFTHPTSSQQAESLSYSTPGLKAPIAVNLSKDGKLSLKALQSAQEGKSYTLPVTVHCRGGQFEAHVLIRIVASSKPLARIPERHISLAAGHTQSLDLLTDAFNPFPKQPLVAVSTRTDSPFITAHIGADGRVSLAAQDHVTAAHAQVFVTVADATKAASRQVEAQILVDFINRPSPPQFITSALEVGDGQVTLSWQPAAPMGSPITAYELAYTGRQGQRSQSCGTTTRCTIRDLENGTTYSFAVRAHNAIGWSDFSSPLATSPDTQPGRPSNVHIDGSQQELLEVSWQPAPTAGSRVSGYRLQAQGPGCGRSRGRTPQSTSAIFDVPHAQAGLPCTVSVTAVNRAGEGETSSITGSTWSLPDEPSFSFARQLDPQHNPSLVSISLKAGPTHGRACSAIDLTIAGVSPSRFALSLPCQEASDSITRTITIPSDLVGRTITLEAAARAQDQPSSTAPPKARMIVTLEGRSTHE
ncbi:ATPase AAA [Bombiscardovia nodaiensis]|uniref:ATPase AAA n=1 Tax=Bombiscardovia nodaiensis TaxID=2932181 RepID=A0ABM8BA01_9BIFI|nr:ATPase AAA [Bombiscardovia nodaiensis]